MKKLFATLLAATMVAGTAVSAFAWENKVTGITPASTDDDYTLATKAYYDDVAVESGHTVKGDTKIYYPILVDGDAMDNKGGAASGEYYFATYASEVDGLRVSIDDVRGGKYIKGANIVRKDLGLTGATTPAAAGTFTANASLAAGYATPAVAGTYLNTNGDVIVTVKKDATNLWIQLGTVESNKVPLATSTQTDFTIGDATNYVTVTVADPATTMATDGTEITLGTVAGATPEVAGDAVGKVYCVEVALEDYFGTSETELEYELKLRTRSTQYDTEDDTDAPATYFNLGSDAKEGTQLKHGVSIDFDGDSTTKNDTTVKFRNNELTLGINQYTGAINLDEATTSSDVVEEVEMIFLEGDNFTYEVKASSEGEEFLKVTTDANKKVVVANQNAKMDFLNFDGEPEFDFTGTLKFSVEDPDVNYYFYEIVDGKPVKTTAKYNKEDETFDLRTRTLGSYVISDKELDVEDTTTDEDTDKPTTEKPVEPTEPTNPTDPSTPDKNVPTGAIA